jgi:hypothetical protein
MDRPRNGSVPTVSGAETRGRHSAPWFCVCTKPNQTRIAAAELQAAGFPTFFPVYQPRRGPATPMFGRYGFAQPNSDGQWVGMLYKRGVAAVIRNPLGVPKAVPSDTMDELFSRCLSNVVHEPEPALPSVGSPIRIVDGSLAGFCGIFARATHDRVYALVELLGRRMEIGFSRGQVEAA